MVIRYFKQGPKGNWRRGVEAIGICDKGVLGIMGRLHLTNGKIGPEVGYAADAIERNLASEDWREVPAEDVMAGRDKPKTTTDVW